MHFRLIPQRRFPGHSLPLRVLESRSPLSVVRASLTARSAATIFRSWRLQATSAILQGNNWASGLNTHNPAFGLNTHARGFRARNGIVRDGLSG